MNSKKEVQLSAIIVTSLLILTIIFSSSIKTNPGFETTPIIVPEWIIQDALALIICTITIIFIIKNEKHPEIIILEMICFSFLYAAVYENFATMVGYYRYGSSLIMILNVPLTVPLIEYIIIYATLRLLSYTSVPNWAKPLITGLFGILFDFTLDPVAIKQVATTALGTIGRWTWFIKPTDINFYGEPVYNFTGWFLLCAYATTFLLIGRKYYTENKEKKIIGYTYPIIAMIASLILLVSPLSRFLLWLEPFYSKGEASELAMLITCITIPGITIGIFLRKKIKPISVKKEYIIFLILIGFHVINILFTLIGNYMEILWIEILAGSIQTGIILLIYKLSKKK